MTGRYPSHTGIGPQVIRPGHPYGMPSSEVFMSQKFKSANYSTHAVGKWHLGFCDERYTPTFRGFDSFTGYLCGAEDYYQHTRGYNGYKGLDFRNSTSLSSAGKLPPADYTHNGSYSAHIFAAQVDRIASAHDPRKPLFLYVPLQSVHAPLEAPQHYIDAYNKTIKDKSRRKYAGMVSAMDEAVRNIVDSFVKAGLWNDTLLVFTTGKPKTDNPICLKNCKPNHISKPSLNTLTDNGGPPG